ncbi:hypothetical protein YC2023_099028 [Brassica napus]
MCDGKEIVRKRCRLTTEIRNPGWRDRVSDGRKMNLNARGLMNDKPTLSSQQQLYLLFSATIVAIGSHVNEWCRTTLAYADKNLQKKILLGWRCSYHLNLTELDWLFCHRTWSHIPCRRLHKRIVKKQRNFQSVVYKYVFKKNEEQMTHKHRRFDHGLNRIRVGLSK